MMCRGRPRACGRRLISAMPITRLSRSWHRAATAGAIAAAFAWTVRASQPAPSLSLHVPVPPSAVAVDGRDTYTYELHVANEGDVALNLTTFELRTDAAGAVISFAGDRLAPLLDTPADASAPFAVAPRSHRVIYVDLGARAVSHGQPARVSRVRHGVRATAPDGTEIRMHDGEGLRIDDRAPVVLGPPLAGGPWAAVYHAEWPRGHRRVFYTVDGASRLPGRHTIDFVKLDDQGRTARADVDVVSNTLGYGAEVLAVSDATVAARRDGVTEVPLVSARETRHAPEAAAGNFVSLDLGGGRFAVYEHLRPGSLRVREGQRVRRGDVIAALGFTGSSTGPHLHLHVGDAAAPLAAEGQPFVFDSFRVLGRYADVGLMGRARWLVEGEGPRTRERPSPNAVVDFGPAPRPPGR